LKEEKDERKHSVVKENNNRDEDSGIETNRLELKKEELSSQIEFFSATDGEVGE
jgi:hypothetical protein